MPGRIGGAIAAVRHEERQTILYAAADLPHRFGVRSGGRQGVHASGHQPEQAEALVRSIPQVQERHLDSRNLRAAGEYYQKMLSSHDCADLVQLIKTIYSKQQSAQAAGRKGGQVDERYRKRAEETLYGELAVALDIPKDSVEEYIKKIIEEETAALV